MSLWIRAGQAEVMNTSKSRGREPGRAVMEGGIYRLASGPIYRRLAVVCHATTTLRLSYRKPVYSPGFTDGFREGINDGS